MCRKIYTLIVVIIEFHIKYTVEVPALEVHRKFFHSAILTRNGTARMEECSTHFLYRDFYC